MGLPGDAEVLHHVLEHAALGDRAAVEIKQGRSALKRKLRIRFRRHRIEQEAQRRFYVLAVDTAVFLITHAAAVIDHAEQHQGRLAPAGFAP